LSRHRKTPGSRSKAIVLVVAGAFTVATAASAAAATWPQGSSRSSAPSAHDAAAGVGLGAGLTDQTGQAHAVADSTADQALQAYRLRDTQAELAAARWQAAQERAARAAKKAAAARAARAAAQAAAQPSASQSAQTAPAAAAPSGSAQQIAAAMLGSFGWSSSQFSCLDPLWQHESGWSVTAANPDGAYGIPQALPGAKMASAGPDWQTDAATQIRWGLEYIKSLYGSPCGAWDHELATGWY
jgi:nucleoid-associated protein YgaU